MTPKHTELPELDAAVPIDTLEGVLARKLAMEIYSILDDRGMTNPRYQDTLIVKAIYRELKQRANQHAELIR